MVLKLLLLNSNGIQKFSEEKYKDYKVEFKDHPFQFSLDQKKSLKLMNKSKNKFRVHVLQGITGSGKTFVYFEALKNLIKNGFQGLILLPEIGLTSQFEQKFFEFFGLNPQFGIQKLLEKKGDYMEWCQ